MIIKNFFFFLILNSTLFSQELQVKIDSIETILQIKELNLQYFQNEVDRLKSELQYHKNEKAINGIDQGKIKPIFVNVLLPEKAALWIEVPIYGKRVELSNVKRIKIFPKFYKKTTYVLAEHNGRLGWLSSIFYDYDKLPLIYKGVYQYNKRSAS